MSTERSPELLPATRGPHLLLGLLPTSEQRRENPRIVRYLRNLRKKWRQRSDPNKVARDRWRRKLYKRRRLPTWDEIERRGRK